MLYLVEELELSQIIGFIAAAISPLSVDNERTVSAQKISNCISRTRKMEAQEAKGDEGEADMISPLDRHVQMDNPKKLDEANDDEVFKMP